MPKSSIADAHAKLTQAAEHLRRPVPVPDQFRFGDFQRQHGFVPRRGDRFHQLQESRLTELKRGDVHGDSQVLHPLGTPGFGLMQGGSQGPFTQVQNGPRGLRQRDESGGFNHAECRVCPSNQRLHRSHPARFQIHHRLILQRHFAAFHGVGQFPLHGVTLVNLAIDFRRVESVAGSTLRGV